MTDQRKEHPSGRPVHRRVIVQRPLFRVPDDGFVTPRLRKDTNTTAAGFVHRFSDEENPYD